MKRTFPSWIDWARFHLRQLLWPSMGWRRFLTLFILRLLRMRGSDQAVARGFACGAALSMTPLVGLHFITSALLAKFIRGNWVAGILGTIVGNPWTFPFIWLTSFQMGSEILEEFGYHHESYSRAHQRHNDFEHLRQLQWQTLWEEPEKIFFPMLIGSLPMAIVAFVLFYLITLLGLRCLRQHKFDQPRRLK